MSPDPTQGGPERINWYPLLGNLERNNGPDRHDSYVVQADMT